MNRDEQVRRNLELAQGYFGHLLDHPDEQDDLPDGTHVILVPSDDPELADANLDLARSILDRRRDQVSTGTATTRDDDDVASGIYLQSVG